MTTLIAEAAAPVASPRHFLTLADLGPDGLRSLLDLTARLKREPAAFRGCLAGGRIGMIFDKPSTRTRVSFESAAWMLGMLPIVLRPDELQLGRGETIADTARALSLYLDGLTVRTFAQATVEELAGAASIPIINALTNEHHPCQALADVLTLEEEFGALAGLQLAFVGDGDNVCHSLIQAAGLGGFELRVATPEGYEPSEAVVMAAREQARLDRRHDHPDPRSGRGRHGRRRGLRRRVDLDGPGDRARRAAGRLRRLPGRRAADGAGLPVRDLPALPAGPSRRRGHRRGHRRTGLARLAPGRQPAPHRDGAALHGAHRRRRRRATPVTRVVVALGGNALIRRGEAGSIEVQRHNLLGAARALVDLEGMGHELVLTHGNGPQVGFLAIEADAAAATVPPPPLDVLVAESMGQIGYLLAQALDGAPRQRRS